MARRADVFVIRHRLCVIKAFCSVRRSNLIGALNNLVDYDFTQVVDDYLYRGRPEFFFLVAYS